MNKIVEIKHGDNDVTAVDASRIVKLVYEDHSDDPGKKDSLDIELEGGRSFGFNGPNVKKSYENLIRAMRAKDDT